MTVRGYADLFLSTSAGRTYRFKEIVQIEDQGDRFFLRSASRFGLVLKDDVRATELRQLDRLKTVVVICGVTVALTAPLVLLAFVH